MRWILDWVAPHLGPEDGTLLLGNAPEEDALLAPGSGPGAPEPRRPCAGPREADHAMWCRRTNWSMAVTKARLMAAIRTEEAKVCPRWARKKKKTAPASCWSWGTYRFKYIRSILPSSMVVCWLRISATLRRTLVAGSGWWRS